MIHQKVKFGNAKFSSIFYVNCLCISQLLGLVVHRESNVFQASFGYDVKKIKFGVI